MFSPRHPRSRGRLFLFAIAFAYLYPFPYFPRINNPNENVRFYMTAAIVEDGTYHIDGPRSRWGWVNDAAVYEGHYCSVKAPSTSLFGVPAYAFYLWITRLWHRPFEKSEALWAVRFFASILPALIFFRPFLRWLLRRGAPLILGEALVLSLAWGSLLYAYALLFVTHTLSAAAAFGCFMLLFEARRRRFATHLSAFGAGFLCALVTASEYPGFPASLILLIYALLALRPWNRLVGFTLGGLIPTAFVMHFHALCYGSPFRPGHRFLENQDFRQAMHSGFYGADAIHWDAALSLLFHPAYGLFAVTPILFLAFFGFFRLIRTKGLRLDAWVAFWVCFATYGVIVLMNNWRGGWTVGPRYLALTLPFVAWFALEGWRPLFAIHKSLGATLVGACTASSILLQGLPSVYYPHLPEAFDRPFTQLILPLIQYDFAPLNAGRLLFGWTGSFSMLPLFVIWVFTLVLSIGSEFTLSTRLWVIFASLALGAAYTLGLSTIPSTQSLDALNARRFVEDFWTPEGEHFFAKKERAIAEGKASLEEIEALIQAYEEAGRHAEASRLREMGQRGGTP
ncbi:MAG: hypothetical protein RMJ84_04245 [Sandaracinaceae bacterium]|nr:hypothetical protein [Sandaracinaceae bacterium]